MLMSKVEMFYQVMLDLLDTVLHEYATLNHSLDGDIVSLVIEDSRGWTWRVALDKNIKPSDVLPGKLTVGKYIVFAVVVHFDDISILLNLQTGELALPNTSVDEAYRIMSGALNAESQPC